jgi:hypothetical protein
MDQCLIMMNHRMDSAPRQPCTTRQNQGEQQVKTDKEALVFAQGSDKKTLAIHQSMTRRPRAPSLLVLFLRALKLRQSSARIAENRAMSPQFALPRSLLSRFMPWPLSLTTPLSPVKTQCPYPCSGGRPHSSPISSTPACTSFRSIFAR